MKQLSGEEYLNIVDRYYSVLVFFAQKWVHEKAEDVVQESFMKLIRHSELFGPPDNVSPWLFKVVRTTAIDWLRKSESQERLNKAFSHQKIRAYPQIIK
ncbi:MAG: sigma-70 family RNA polymerase sigma factor [Planctomycetia bacterium]|nr:sigma-70 family RNA polymerase sigma factor [Planctomycetia bacterium]